MPQFSILAPASWRDVCAVITAFRPDDGFPERVKRVQSQVGSIIVVDDSGSSAGAVRLRDWFPEGSGVEVHHHPANRGVAAALNSGLSLVRPRGYQWALMLDDDTLIDADMLVRLIDAWRQVSGTSPKPIAVLGMAYRDNRTGQTEPCPADGRLFVEKRAIVTSGSLLPMDVYDRIGPFREEFFIDSVDYDFCLRARAAGFRVVKVCRIGMTHALGHPIRRRIAGIMFETTGHSPIRRYYFYRNSTLLAFEYILRDPAYTLAVWVFQWKVFFKILGLERDRVRKIRLIGRGIWDAWRRHLGRYPGKECPEINPVRGSDNHGV